MSVASLAAFARMHAAHQAFVASYKTDYAPAAGIQTTLIF